MVPFSWYRSIMNKEYISVLSKIVNLLSDNDIDYESEDSFEGTPEVREIDGHVVTINDEHEREQWFTQFGFSTTKEDVELFTSVFGEPSERFDDGANWKVGETLIVMTSQDVQVIRSYTKV